MVQPHKAFPRRIYIFFNTVVARDRGIVLRATSTLYPQIVVGNVVFARSPVSAANQWSNVAGLIGQETKMLNNPDGPLGEMDLFPKTGAVRGRPVSSRLFQDFPDWDSDFNGNPRDLSFRGAYSGQGKNPGWRPALEIKPIRSTSAATLQRGLPDPK